MTHQSPLTPVFKRRIQRGSIEVGGTPSAPPAAPMVMQFDTTLGSGEDVFLTFDDPDVTVDWGDGNSDPLSGSGELDISHTYASAGQYEVQISGTADRVAIGEGSSAQRDKLTSVDQWGDLGITSLLLAFRGCSNLTAVPSVLPSSVTILNATFEDADAFNQDIGSWDTSAVADMAGMFDGASTFNQNISGWDTSSVTQMEVMFAGAVAFNQPIGAWDVSNVSDMSQMFDGATVFNQSLDSWDVGSVESMASMFRSTNAFNGAVASWDVSGVSDMSQMFYLAAAFNRTLNAWDVSSVETMDSMFRNTTMFNGLIDAWDVSSVDDMDRMFLNAGSFNQDLSGWCVSLIPSEPTDFDTGASSWVAARPVWGTCPP